MIEKVPELVRKVVDESIRKDDEYFESVGDVCLVVFADENLRLPREKYGCVATQVWLYRGWQIKKKQKQLDKLKKENEKFRKSLSKITTPKCWDQDICKKCKPYKATTLYGSNGQEVDKFCIDCYGEKVYTLSNFKGN